MKKWISRTTLALVGALALFTLGVQSASATLAKNWQIDAFTTTASQLKSATISSKQLTANVATITTTAPHKFQIGEQVYIQTDGSPVFDSIGPKYTPFTITATPSATTFQYARTLATNVPATPVASGTAFVLWMGTVFENRGMTYNDATGHVLVARGLTTDNSPGIHILNGADGADLGEMKMGPDISNKAKATNVATITTVQNHLLQANQEVFISCDPPDAAFDGRVTIVSVPTPTSFTYTKNGADVASAASAGRANILVYGGSSSPDLTKIRAASGGIYGCSLTLNTQNNTTDVWTVYYWADETAVPYIIFRNNASDGTAIAATALTVGPRLPAAAAATFRLGDTLDVVADSNGAGANVQIYTAKAVQAASGVDRFYKLSFVEGAAAVSAATQTMLLGGDSTGGNLPTGCIWVDGYNGPVFVSSSTEAGYWDNGGLYRAPVKPATSAGDFNCGVLTSGSSGRGVTVGGNKYFAYIERAASGHPDILNGFGRAAVADVTTTFPEARYIDNTGARTDWVRANTNGTGDVAWDDQTARPGRFFAMPTDQYVGSFTVTAPGAPSTKKWDGGAATSRWTDAANWAPDGVPTTDNDVVLDHTNVAGAYTVQISGQHTVVCRTLTVDAANANTIKVRISGEGEACGTPYQANGAGKSDISVSGTYRMPQANRDTIAPRFRVEILKGLTYITRKARTANVATLTTLASNGTDSGLVAGDSITVAIGDASFDGTFTVVSKTATAITYNVNGADVANTDTYGTIQPATETIRWNNINSTTAADFADAAAGTLGRAGASGVSVAAATPITLSDGYSIQFASASGHITGDAWQFNPASIGNALVIKGDGTAANDLVVQNGGSIENYDSARFAAVPGTINLWGGGNKGSFGPNGTHVWGNHIISQTALYCQFPSDWTSAPANYAVFDGATTWDAASNNVTDGYPSNATNVVANYPSVFRSFQVGNLAVMNSYSSLGLANANYSNTANATNLRIKGTLLIGANSSFTLGTTGNVLVEGNVTNNGNTTGLAINGAATTMQFNGNTTYSGSSTANTFANGWTVNAGKSVTLSAVDLKVPSGQVGTVNGVINTGASKVEAGSSAAAVGTIAAASQGVINGTLKQWISNGTATYTLPVGTASTSETASLQFTGAPTTGGSITATFVSGAPGTTGLPLSDTDSQSLGLMNNIGYWSLVSGDSLAGGTYNLSVTANGATPAADTTKMRIVKRPAAGSWAIDGTPGTNAFPVIARTGMSGFSEFGIAQPDPSGIADFMLY